MIFLLNWQLQVEGINTYAYVKSRLRSFTFPDNRDEKRISLRHQSEPI